MHFDSDMTVLWLKEEETKGQKPIVGFYGIMGNEEFKKGAQNYLKCFALKITTFYEKNDCLKISLNLDVISIASELYHINLKSSILEQTWKVSFINNHLPCSYWINTDECIWNVKFFLAWPLKNSSMLAKNFWNFAPFLNCLQPIWLYWSSVQNSMLTWQHSSHHDE